jgi:hypothetical protein
VSIILVTLLLGITWGKVIKPCGTGEDVIDRANFPKCPISSLTEDQMLRLTLHNART